MEKVKKLRPGITERAKHNKVGRIEKVKQNLSVRLAELGEGNKIICWPENITTSAKVICQCNKEHIFSTKITRILHQKSWCRKCKGLEPKDEQYLKTFLLNKYPGSKLLDCSNGCVNNSKIKIQCEKNHIFIMKVRVLVNQGGWCPRCSNNMPEIEELQEFAKNKNGLLLSTEYKNCYTKAKWQCEKEHIWEAIWHSVKNLKTWCPYCHSFKQEEICRAILEKKYDRKFIRERFINLDTNTSFELDGYNDELKIAFEYNGYQHYIYPNYFHKTKEKFTIQQASDRYKKKYCEENNIKLIIIPYTETKIEDFINFNLNK